MTMISKLASVSVLAIALSTPVAFAQGALVGTDALDDRIDAIVEDTSDEFAKSEDANRFGGTQFDQGWTGSLSATAALTSGNTDTSDMSIGGRFRYGAGVWNHTLGFALEYGKDSGVENKNEAFVVYDANRYFSEKFYVFGLASYRHDKFGSIERDGFLGVGPGYRIINTDDMAWRVQAGPGVRYTLDAVGTDTTEAAGIASSRIYKKITEDIFLTNDTDVLYSEVGTLATNDFGVNFKVTDAMATRFGYSTEYNSDPVGGLKNTDNSLTMSIVYGF